MRAYTGRFAVNNRASWARVIYRRGRVDCWRCDLPIFAGATIAETIADKTWDVGHLIDLAQGGHPGLSNTRPEHATKDACGDKGNRSHGATAGNIARSEKTLRKRNWTQENHS